MSPEVQRFRSSAQDFCALVESIDGLSRYEFLTGVNRLLPELYLAALGLPDRFVDGPDLSGHALEEWVELMNRLQAKLGDADHYRGVFDPWSSSEEAIDRSLADDLSDIYFDLRTALGDNRGDDGAWDWRFAFTHHWGAHTAQALLATH